MTFARPCDFALEAVRDAEAIVERLARDGYAVAFTYVSSDAAAQEIEQSLIARGRRAQAIRTGFPGASVCQMTKAAVAAMVKGIALAPMIY